MRARIPVLVVAGLLAVVALWSVGFGDGSPGAGRRDSPTRRQVTPAGRGADASPDPGARSIVGGAPASTSADAADSRSLRLELDVDAMPAPFLAELRRSTVVAFVSRDGSRALWDAGKVRVDFPLDRLGMRAGQFKQIVSPPDGGDPRVHWTIQHEDWPSPLSIEEQVVAMDATPSSASRYAVARCLLTSGRFFRGVAMDARGTPLPGLTVLSSSGGGIAFTDDGGAFFLPCRPGTTGTVRTHVGDEVCEAVWRSGGSVTLTLDVDRFVRLRVRRPEGSPCERFALVSRNLGMRGFSGRISKGDYAQRLRAHPNGVVIVPAERIEAGCRLFVFARGLGEHAISFDAALTGGRAPHDVTLPARPSTADLLVRIHGEHRRTMFVDLREVSPPGSSSPMTYAFQIPPDADTWTAHDVQIAAWSFEARWPDHSSVGTGRIDITREAPPVLDLWP